MALALETFCSLTSGTLYDFGGTKNSPTVETSPAPPYEHATYVVDCSGAAAAKSVTTHPFPEGLNDYVLGFYVRFTNAGTSPFSFARIEGSGSNQEHLYLRPNDNGKLEVMDADYNLVATSASAVFTDNTWHLVELLFTFGDPGDVVVHVDEAEAVTASGEKFDCGAGTALHLTLSGQDTDPLPPSGTDTFFWPPYIYSGASGVGDFVGAYGCLGYQNRVASATPDVGNDLPVGTWADCGETPFNSANYAQYTSPGEIGIVTTDASDGGATPGPYGDARIGEDDEILGATWLYRYKEAFLSNNRGYLHYGDTPNDEAGVDNTSNVDMIGVTAKNMLIVSEDAADVPTRDDFFQGGMSVDGGAGARDIIIYDWIASLFFKLAPPAYRDVSLGSGVPGRPTKEVLVG